MTGNQAQPRIDPAALMRNLSRVLEAQETATTDIDPSLALAAGAVETVLATAAVPVDAVNAIIACFVATAGAEYVEGFITGFRHENVPSERLHLRRYLEGLEDGWSAGHLVKRGPQASLVTVRADEERHSPS